MRIAISGTACQGKTTLINIILGLLKHNSGEINLNGDKLLNNLKEWRSIIGYVPQSITLLDASIKENVALGIDIEKINNKKIITVLKEANLFELVDNLEQKYDTFITVSDVN